MPISNLTSRLFANIYLDELDHFVKERLRIKRSLRYMDDFRRFHDDKHVSAVSARSQAGMLTDRPFTLGAVTVHATRTPGLSLRPRRRAGPATPRR